MICFTKENLYHITVYIPKPHGSLRVAHTTSVQKQIYITSFLKKWFSLCMIQRQKPQNTFNLNKTTSNQHKSNAQALTPTIVFWPVSKGGSDRVSSQLSRKVYNHPILNNLELNI